MDNNFLKLKKSRTPIWKLQISCMGDSFNHDFPDEYGFIGSEWAEQVSRIQQGQKQEEVRLNKLLESKEKYNSNTLEDVAEDYYLSCSVTNNMYAALIVSLWSKSESMFMYLIQASKMALGDNPKSDKYTFKKIRDYFKSNINLELSSLPYFTIVNAIRILNNSFKHKDGRYYPDLEDSINRIDHSLIDNWNLLKGNEEINYSNLNIQELVLSCHSFFKKIIQLVESYLNENARIDD